MRSYAEYARGLRERAAAIGVAVEPYGKVVEGGASYVLLAARVPGEPVVTITSGFHGEEPAGPLALLERLSEIAAHARARGVGLRIYPCANPSGFEDGTRYNRSGERPNNDFLRSEGVRWTPFREGPKETRALLAALERDPPPLAALDIHQDASVSGPCCYAYVFGERAPFRPLIEAAGRLAPIRRGAAVYGNATDAEGFIDDHDGSVSDYLLRRGARYVAALETSTDTPLADAIEIDAIWMRGLVDLAAEARG